MRRIAVVAALALAGCQTSPPAKPQIVTVTVEKIVAVPDQLTEPCRNEVKRNNTVGEAVRLANVRKEAIDECSKRMAEIRALGRKP